MKAVIKHQKYGHILGVGITSTSMEALLRKITVDIKNNHKIFITTPNPEQIVLAQKDSKFLTILNKSDIAIADGIGILAARKFLEMRVPQNLLLKILFSVFQGLVVGVAVIVNRKWLEKESPLIHGSDLFFDLIKLSNKNSWKVYFLGGERGEALGAKKELEKNFKNIKIKYDPGPILNMDGTPNTSTDKALEQKIISEINSFSPDILFVGISHPRQEKWLYRWKDKLDIKCAMVVGGTFKFYAKHTKLAPKFIDNIGLSWLWRLLTGDQKISRIFTAVIIFPLKVFFFKLLAK